MSVTSLRSLGHGFSSWGQGSNNCHAAINSRFYEQMDAKGNSYNAVMYGHVSIIAVGGRERSARYSVSPNAQRNFTNTVSGSINTQYIR